MKYPATFTPRSMATAFLTVSLALVACGGQSSTHGTDKSPPNVTDPGTSEPGPDDATDVEGVTHLEWTPPDARENGDYLEDYEIGGYEIRYRSQGEDDYQQVYVENGVQTEYEFEDLAGTYEFEIAAYDTDGLYSDYVTIQPLN